MSELDDFELPEKLEGAPRIRQLRYALHSAVQCWPILSKIQTIYSAIEQNDAAELVADMRGKLADVIVITERAIADELQKRKSLAWGKSSRAYAAARALACARLANQAQSAQYQAGD